MQHDNPRLGAIFIVVSAFMFAAMGAAIKTLSDTLPSEMTVFFRNLFGLAALAPFALRRGLRGLRTHRWRHHVLRALAGLGSMYCFFYAIAHMHLAEAVLLSYTTPLFTPLIALFWLNEPFTRRLIAAVLVGFSGVLLILQPGAGALSWISLVGLASGLFAAVALVTVRRMTGTEPITRIVFYFGAISTVVSAVPLTWAWHTPSAHDLRLLLLVGALATLGQLALTKGYSLGPAARVGPFTYVAVVFAALWGWLLWSEVPTLLLATGALCIIAGGALALGGLALKPTASGQDTA